MQAAFRFKEAGRIHVQSEETKGLISMFTHSPLLGDCTLFVLVLHNACKLFFQLLHILVSKKKKKTLLHILVLVV
jgi:hypothetical protein